MECGWVRRKLWGLRKGGYEGCGVRVGTGVFMPHWAFRVWLGWVGGVEAKNGRFGGAEGVLTGG